MEPYDPKKFIKLATILSSLIGFGVFAFVFISIRKTSGSGGSPQVIIWIIAAVMILSTIFQVKMMNKAKFRTPGFSLFQQALSTNPQFFANIISDKAHDKNAILLEIQKFKKIKESKEIDPTSTDLTVIHADNSEHRYRITTEKEGNEKKITALSRYS